MSKQEFNTGIHDLDTILDHLVGAGYNDDKFYFADRQSLLNDIRDLERTAELYHINNKSALGFDLTAQSCAGRGRF